MMAANGALRTRDGRLLEREAEICELGSLLGEVRTGRGGVSVVEGPAGIGKSRLLGAVREDALAAGMLPLRARPSQLELDYPFGVVRQLFEPALARIDDPEPLFAGAAALARQVVASASFMASTG